MPDVIQIARKRRERLASEIAKLDDFIQMAESLMKWHHSQGDGAAGLQTGGAPGPGDISARPGAA